MQLLQICKARLENADCIWNCIYRKQLLAALIVNILSFSHGIAIGWAAPTIFKLISNDTPLPFPVSVSQASWIGSLISIGSVTASILFGCILNVFGRKCCLYLIAVPHVAFWFFIYFAKNIWCLYVGRYFAGMPGGAASLIIPIFVSEIADARIRGSLGTFFTFSVNIGITIGYVMASYLDYYLMPIVALVFPLLFIALTMILPETAQHMLRKENFVRAEKSYAFYKNITDATREQQIKEFEILKKVVVKQQDEAKNVGVSWRDFVARRILLIHCNAVVLLILNQFSGIFVFVNYMSMIFEKSGSALSPDASTIVIGVVQIAGLAITTVFIDVCGRKLLLSISSCGVALGLALFGVYTYLNGEILIPLEYHSIPLVLMCFIVFVGNVGVVAFTGLIIVEIYPVKIRSTAFSICLTLYGVLNFITLKEFPVFIEEFGISLTMWILCGITLICFLYLLYFLPETKGKSLDVE